MKKMDKKRITRILKMYKFEKIDLEIAENSIEEVFNQENDFNYDIFWKGITIGIWIMVFVVWMFISK